MNYYLAAAINLICAALPLVIGSTKWAVMDKASRIFFILLACSLLTECIASYTAQLYRNNIWIYNISNIIQSFLLCLYFNYTIKFLRKRNIGWYIGFFSVALGILNLVWLQPLQIFNSYYFLYQTLLVVALGFILYIQLIMPVYYKFQYNPHFWLISVLVFFYVFNFLGLSLYDYFTGKLKGHKHIIDDAITMLGALTNVGFACIFLFYDKMKDHYAR